MRSIGSKRSKTRIEVRIRYTARDRILALSSHSQCDQRSFGRWRDKIDGVRLDVEGLNARHVVARGWVEASSG